MAAVVTWLRDDLRLDDNPALMGAVNTGLPVMVLYIWSPEDLGDEAPHGASRWWLHYALEDLDAQLRKRGSSLVILRGHADECLRTAMERCGATDVFWNRRYTPAAAQLDDEIAEGLSKDGFMAHTSNASLLYEPLSIIGEERPYKIFTAFYNAATKMVPRTVAGGGPATIKMADVGFSGVTLESLDLLAKEEWTKSIERAWVPTLAGLETLLLDLPRLVFMYDEERDFPHKLQTSRLSPYLRFGQISVSRIMNMLRELPSGPGRACFEKELHWREFAYHTLYNFQDIPAEPMNPKFSAMPWRDDKKALKAWQQGQTGYPIVDAGMRQLRQKGWMHNRVRMITASFLVKDLLLDWHEGYDWFMDNLVDADVANNALGWQWVTGCGFDAAPFFRVFNPALQSRKFDDDGYYIRRYVPELAYLPQKWIHEPWLAPESVLKEAGVKIGKDYPKPIVDHAMARIRALEALATTKQIRT